MDVSHQVEYNEQVHHAYYELGFSTSDSQAVWLFFWLSLTEVWQLAALFYDKGCWIKINESQKHREIASDLRLIV